MRKELRAEMKNSRKLKKQDDENSSEGFQKPQEPIVDDFAIRNEIIKLQADRLRAKQLQLDKEKINLERRRQRHVK
jgi:hypothetical protein